MGEQKLTDKGKRILERSVFIPRRLDKVRHYSFEEGSSSYHRVISSPCPHGFGVLQFDTHLTVQTISHGVDERFLDILSMSFDRAC